MCYAKNTYPPNNKYMPKINKKLLLLILLDLPIPHGPIQGQNIKKNLYRPDGQSEAGLSTDHLASEIAIQMLNDEINKLVPHDGQAGGLQHKK